MERKTGSPVGLGRATRCVHSVPGASKNIWLLRWYLCTGKALSPVFIIPPWSNIKAAYNCRKNSLNGSECHHH